MTKEKAFTFTSEIEDEICKKIIAQSDTPEEAIWFALHAASRIIDAVTDGSRENRRYYAQCFLRAMNDDKVFPHHQFLTIYERTIKDIIT